VHINRKQTTTFETLPYFVGDVNKKYLKKVSLTLRKFGDLFLM